MHFYSLYIIFIFYHILPSETRKSKITFQNGDYNNIFVGLDENLSNEECVEVVAQIRSVFALASAYLQGVTSNRAKFGTINIIIRSTSIWENPLSYCGFPNNELELTHLPYDTFEEADFKVILNHPLAKTIPWTKQYKGCGESAEAIFIPVEYLRNNADFDDAAKGRQLLHDWMKFRYGVFEEHGYYSDPIYSPCYTKNKALFYSSCTDNNGMLNPIESPVGNEEIPPERCRELVQQNTATLQAELSLTNPSIMYNPFLNNGRHVCSDTTHNGRNPTKQNVLCERRSVSDVMNSHPDFTGKENTFGSPFPSPRELTFRIVTQMKNLGPAYFIVIEDTVTSRQFGRLKHVKQAMAEFLRLAADETLIHIIDTALVHIVSDTLSDTTRAQILGKIPDGSANAGSSRPLDEIFSRAISIMNTPEILRKWELVLIVSSPPTAVPQALATLSATDYPVSILTFNDAREWLQFNTIPNTRKIVHLPYCFSADGMCHGRTSALITDHFMELINGLKLPTEPHQRQRFFHKVVDAHTTMTNPTMFTIPDLVEGSIGNFYLFMPVYDDFTTPVTVSREGSGQTCDMTELLQYGGVYAMNCQELGYTAGNWFVSISDNAAARRRAHVISGYVETSGTPRDLKIVTTYGFKPESVILPTINHRFPIYASITNANHQPIVRASVQLQVIYQQNDASYYWIYNARPIQLLDDGQDPDITENDGVYSALITSFSSIETFHSGYIAVTTSSSSGSVQEFINEAALLNSVANSRCCGSLVAFSEETLGSVGYATYSRVIPSFRTGETFVGEIVIPPSRIQSKIKIIEVTDEYITLEFRAPGANHKEGVVSHYNICCTESESANLDESMSVDISTTGCDPVGYNQDQECSISLVAMYEAFYSTDKPEGVESVTLYCGLKGVDADDNEGPISAFLFEMVLEFDVLENIRANSDECKSVSDGCLPMWVFWVLIGCVALVLVILLVVLLWWCCSARNTEPKPKPKKEIERIKEVERKGTQTDDVRIESVPSRNTSNPNLPLGTIPLHKVYINEAYIHERNGHLRLVASDGQFLDSNGNSNNSTLTKQHRHTGSNDRMIEQNSFEDRKFRGQVPDRTAMDDQTSEKDMPIFFTNTSARPAPTHSNPRTRTERQQLGEDHENIYARPNSGILPPRFSHNLRDRVHVAAEEPIPKSRQSKPKNMYINPRFSPRHTNGHGNLSPVYSSISRNGHHTPDPDASNPQHAAPQTNPYHVSNAVRSPEQFSSPTPQTLPQRFTTRPERPESRRDHVPSSGSGKMATNAPPSRQGSATQPTQKIIPLPPVRLDHFPSSESETYSDMSHIITAARKPDRTPVQAHHNNHNHMHSNSNSVQQQRERNMSPIKEQPPPLPKTPPNQNRFQLRRGVRGSANRPQNVPPPPPRKQSQSAENVNEEYYDDDSDEWGNYDDDGAFPPTGQSYA